MRLRERRTPGETSAASGASGTGARKGDFVPTLPAVNLLSPSAVERLATRRLRRRFVLAGAVLVVLVTAAWGAQHLRVAEAEQLLAVEQAETARLTQETQALLPVRAFVTGVEQQLAIVGETMSREIYFSVVLEGLQDAAPSGVQLDSVAVTLAEPPVEEPAAPAPAEGEAAEGTEDTTPVPPPVPQESACPGPDPFNTRTVVGCVTLSGSASSRAEVGDLVIRLGEDALFVEPFISTTTTGDAARVTFSGSVGLSKKVFSERYADLEKLLAEEALR
jgi:Tfp pilus assembly protein PilN